MESDNFFDEYKQYKKGTVEIATWLVETAESIGVDLVSSHALHSNRRTGSVMSRLPLSVDDLSRLSKAICRSPRSSSIEFPSTIVETFKAVITARKRSTELYSKRNENRTENDKRSHLNHEYFVHVLEDALEMLRSHLVPQIKTATNPTQSKPISTKAANLARMMKENRHVTPTRNRFDGLIVEDPEWGDVPSQPVPQVQPSLQSSAIVLAPKISYDIEESLEDEFNLACSFFLRQCQELLDIVTEGWHQVRTHASSPVNVALVANAACDILQRTELELCKTFSSAHSEEEIVEKVIASFSKEAGRPGSSFHKSNVDVMMHGIYVLLKALHDEYGPDGIPAINDYHVTQLPAYRPGKGIIGIDLFGYRLKEISQRDCMDELSVIMLECILLFKHFGHIPMADGSITGLKDAMETGKIRFCTVFAWLIVAIQIKRPVICMNVLTFLHNVSDTTLSRVREHLDFKWDPVCCGMGQSRKTCFSLIKHIATWIRGDPINKAKDGLFGTKQSRPRTDFLKRHPVLAALLTFGILRVQHHHARQLSNERGLIANLAHLYNAAKQRQLIPEWEDMETMISFHGEKSIFIGRRPRDNFWKRASIANGSSIRNFSSDAAHRHGYFHSDQKDTYIRLMDPWIWEVYDETWDFGSDCAFKSRRGQAQCQTFESMLTFIYGRFGVDDDGTTANGHRRFLTTDTYGFFCFVIEDLQDHEQMLYFDYMAMVRKGARLLMTLRDDFAQRTQTVLESSNVWDVRDSRIYQVVRLLLEEDEFADRGSAKNDLMFSLEDAGPKFKQLIESEGNKETKAMHHMMNWLTALHGSFISTFEKLLDNSGMIIGVMEGRDGDNPPSVEEVMKKLAEQFRSNARTTATKKTNLNPGKAKPTK